MARYLVEGRLGNEKQDFRDIIRDVRREFDLSATHRPVPHVTLFGPYDTSEGYEAKDRIQDVLSDYRVVPYRVAGFGSFPDTEVVYAEVKPSDRLRELRRSLATRLAPVTQEYRPWDTNETYEFHITIATDLGQQREQVLQYVREEYDVDMRLYAQRVSVLDRGKIMWEWDLPRSTELSSRYATSKESWEKTTAALEAHKGDEPPRYRRILKWIL